MLFKNSCTFIFYNNSISQSSHEGELCTHLYRDNIIYMIYTDVKSLLRYNPGGEIKFKYIVNLEILIGFYL